MDLLIDAGNTKIKWCLCDQGMLSKPTSLNYTDSGLIQLETQWSTLERPITVWLANVAGDSIERQITDVAQRLWQSKLVMVKPRKQAHGITVAYADPQRLGVDRWLAMLAVWQHSNTPAVVVDCGTAITLDVIDGVGNHQGGLILPGLHTMQAALNSRLNLPLPWNQPIRPLGIDTQSCIAAGIMQAIVGMIERAYNRLCVDNEKPRIVLTGGDSKWIAAQLTLPYALIPGLVMEGLALIRN